VQEEEEEEEEEEEFASPGERLQYARENAGYSRPELARIARLDYRTVLRAEHGKTSPRAATLRSPAKTLGVSIQASALYPERERTVEEVRPATPIGHRCAALSSSYAECTMLF